MAAAVAIVAVGLAARAIGRGGGEKEEGGMGEMGGMGVMGGVGVVGEKEGREGEAAGCSVIRGSKKSKRTSHVFAEKETVLLSLPWYLRTLYVSLTLA